MKRVWIGSVLGISVLAFVVHGIAGDVEDKLGARLRARVNAESMRSRWGFIEKGGRQEELVRVFVGGASAGSAVRASGGFVNTEIGKWITAEIPIARVLNIAGEAGVDRMRLGVRMRASNDRLVEDVRADHAHAGQAPLGNPRTGHGVIIGIIDTGIDVTHPDFQHADGSSRIVSIWDQTDDGGSSPSGYSYGTEWTKAQIDLGLCTHEDPDGHGTHVAGTAAGNGRAVADFSGVAPDAELIIVALDFESSTGVVDGASYIYQKASQMGRPCVINASLGSHFGPHDGTSPEPVMLDALIDAEAGRAFCAAAGNEGNDYIHVSYPASNDSLWSYYHAEGDGEIVLYLRVPSAYLQSTRFAVGVDESNFNPITRTGGPTAYLGRSPWYSVQDLIDDSDGTKSYRARFAGLTHGRVLFELDLHPGDGPFAAVLITIDDQDLEWDDDAGTVENLDLWRFMVWGGHPDIHAWIADVGRSYLIPSGDTRYRPQDNVFSVGFPAVARRIIAVGASVNRTTYVDQAGSGHGLKGTVGDLADFSSRGPTVDLRTKPDIVVPGSGVISSASQAAVDAEAIDADRIVAGGKHAVFSGTSMSSPGAAGSLALYFEQYPDADVDQIVTGMRRAAVEDEFTGGALPDQDWGWGKMDAFGMLIGTGFDGQAAPPADFVLEQNYPNPFNPMTSIEYTLPEKSQVRLAVLDGLGREVTVLLNGIQPAGSHTAVVDGSRWSSGIYVCRMEVRGRILKTKMLLMK